MGFYVPWVIDGAKHSARLFRREHQLNVGDGSGIARPADLKVQALAVPGTGFRVAAGGATAQSRDSSAASRESYAVVNDAQIVVSDVPGTGSSGARRDLVILEITDPEMQSKTYPAPSTPEGWQDGGNFCRVTVIPDVDSMVPAAQRPVKSLDQLTTGAYANVTGVTLAAIKWPASTGTITNAMIEDLREVQSPRRAELTFARPRVAADDGPQNFLTKRTSDGGEYFPGGGGYANQFEAFVPPWATRMILEPHWMSVRYVGGKNVRGRYWMEFGTEYRAGTWPGKRQYEFATQQFQFDAAENGNTHRTNWPLMDNVAVPAKLRGKNVTFVFKAGLGDEKPTPSFPGDGVNMDALSGLGCKLTFVETALTWEDAI